MSFLKTLGLTTLTLFVALALNADPAMAKPKHKGGKWKNKHDHEMIKMEEEHDREMIKMEEEEYRERHKDFREQRKEHFKREKEARKENRHGWGHGKHNCDRPYGLEKQDKMPPGWAKRCGHRPHAHDRSNQDPGYHEPDRNHDRHAGKTSPCTISGKAKDVAVGTAMGSVLGGVIGSGTGDTEAGAVFGGVVGGIIGATAGDGDKSTRPKC